MSFTLDDLSKTKVGQRPENAHLLAGLQTKVPKSNRGREVEDRQLVKGKKGVAFRIRLIVVSRRRMDNHDNLRSACKPIVDAITASLGFASDDDPRLSWHYSQINGGRDSRD